MAEHNCKGSHLILAREWFEAHFGAGAFARFTESAPQAYPAIVLPGGWYDVAPLARAFEGASAELGRPVSALVSEVARQNALQDLTTIYRVFLRVAAPVRLLSFSAALWRNYVQFAHARAIRNDPGVYVGGCDGVPRRYLEWASGAWLGFVPTAIELAGGRKPTAAITKTRAIGGDEWALECEIRYGVA
jgi:hypothetical protein